MDSNQPVNPGDKRTVHWTLSQNYILKSKIYEIHVKTVQAYLSEASSCPSQVSCMFRTTASNAQRWRCHCFQAEVGAAPKHLLYGWFHKQGFRGFKGEKGEPGLPGLDGLDAPCPVVWCSFFPYTSHSISLAMYNRPLTMFAWMLKCANPL